MYDIQLKNIRRGILFGLPFLFAGLLFFTFGTIGIFYGTIQKFTLDSHTQAKEIAVNKDSDGKYSPSYTYIVNGEEYECSSSYSSTTPVNRSDTTIYYDSKTPWICRSPYQMPFSIYHFISIMFPLISIWLGIYQIVTVKKKIKVVKRLNQTGTLIKHLPYFMVPTGMRINNSGIMAPAVIFTFPTGETRTLIGDARFDYKDCDDDGSVDLLIDYEHPDDYFIDFEINQISDR